MMLLAVLLQYVAVLVWVAGGWLVLGAGGAAMAAAVVVFLVGWSLEQKLNG